MREVGSELLAKTSAVPLSMYTTRTLKAPALRISLELSTRLLESKVPELEMMTLPHMQSRDTMLSKTTLFSIGLTISERASTKRQD
ncbi:hypothetical protein Hte_004616 [Hypoxylon texense]